MDTLIASLNMVIDYGYVVGGRKYVASFKMLGNLLKSGECDLLVRTNIPKKLRLPTVTSFGLFDPTEKPFRLRDKTSRRIGWLVGRCLK